MAGAQSLEWERAAELLDYDPLTGILTWKVGNVGQARRKLGREAGTWHREGYRKIKIDGQYYQAHRIAWFLVHKTWPRILDHKDGNRANNRLSNLRECTPAENSHNINAPTRNRSGHKGVYMTRSKQRYFAAITVSRKTIYLGTFMTAEDAAKAYRDAKRVYHPFANSNNSPAASKEADA